MEEGQEGEAFDCGLNEAALFVLHTEEKDHSTYASQFPTPVVLFPPVTENLLPAQRGEGHWAVE